MDFRRNIFLDISNKNILGTLFKNNDLKSSIGIKLKEISDKSKIRTDLKNKRAYIILEGRQVYIKLMSIPKVKHSLINNIIKNELKYYFKDIKNMMFSYTISNIHETYIDVIVFCINLEEDDILNEYINNVQKIKNINLIQFCLFNYLKNKFVEDNFVFGFSMNSYLYIMNCENYKIINSVTISDYSNNKLEYYIEKFLIQYTNISKDKKIIYLCNIKLDNKNLFKQYNLVDLGFIDKTEVIRYYLKNGVKI